MDYAFTKKTGIHTHSESDVSKILYGIEQKFAYEFNLAVKKGDIKEPFTHQFFKQKENIAICEYTSLYHAEIIDIPIKQRLLIFARNDLIEPQIESIKQIIDTLASDKKYNYTWIGIMSGSGYSPESIEFVSEFHKNGIGLAFIDAVTKKLWLNTKTEEGRQLNSMFLSECIS